MLIIFYKWGSKPNAMDQNPLLTGHSWIHWSIHSGGLPQWSPPHPFPDSPRIPVDLNWWCFFSQITQSFHHIEKLTSAKRRAGMAPNNYVHNHPSNPQQPIHSLRLASVRKKMPVIELDEPGNWCVVPFIGLHSSADQRHIPYTYGSFLGVPPVIHF